MAYLQRAEYPLEPSQMPSAVTTGRGEATGMILCPIRRAEIAIMRCGEYQERDGCGKGCANAAPAAALADLRAAMAHTGGTYDVARDYGVCADDCGQPAVFASSGLCRDCSKRATASRRRTAPLCVKCGGKKKSRTGTTCYTCAARLRNEQRRRERAA